jgi:PPOX class probable F420-dependent enzyme
MSTTKEQALAFLAEGTRVGRIATVSADGVPHVVPVWFRLDGDRLLVHTQGESRKARNIRATGRFSMTVDKDTFPYKGVSVGGPARTAGDDEVDSVALVRELAVEYMGPEAGPGMGDYIAAIPGEHLTLVLDIEDTELWDYSQ